jgi:tetratricopeptide (TPR) repeat protein
MITSLHPHRPSGRIICSLALAAALAFGATACGGDGGDKGGSSSVKPDAKKATTALDAGLKAHAAGDLDTASSSYHTALKYDADNKFAFYNLALIDSSDGNYGLAETKYRSAIKSDAKYEPALFNLAILRTTSDPTEAIGLYKRAVAANEKDAAAWLNLGLLLRTEGKATLGNQAVRKAIALNPKLTDPKAPAKGKKTAAN